MRTALCVLAAALVISGLRPLPGSEGIVLVVAAQVDRNDNTGPLTLREAIIAANAAGGESTIYLPAGEYQLSIPGTDKASGWAGDLDITGRFIIRGAGADRTVIRWDASEPQDRVFEVRPGAALTLVGITVSNGYNLILNRGTLALHRSALTHGRSTFEGGAIINTGLLTASKCVFSNNWVRGGGASGGAIYNLSPQPCRISDSLFSGNLSTGGGAGGGGIWNDVDSNLTIERSAFIDNGGGAIANEHAALSVSDSTFARNAGEAVMVGGYVDVHLTRCTIAGNRADTAGADSETAGGIYVKLQSTVVLQDCIVAGNFNRYSTRDIYGEIVSLGHNLIGTRESASGFHRTDRIGVDPKLALLGDYGGLTPTYALLPGSPAIDSGSSSGVGADQRGAARPFPPRGRIDPGAFELTRPPILALPTGMRLYRPGDPPALLDPAARLYDADSSTFIGGSLSAAITSGVGGGDRLSVLDEGMGPGQVGARGGRVFYGGALIGSFGGGAGSIPLVVRFTTGAPAAEAVRAVLRRIAFANESASPAPGPRTIALTVNDESGHPSSPAACIVAVAPASPAVTDRASLARDDTYTALRATPLHVPAPGVLSNDSDADGDVMRAVLVDPPQRGKVTLDADGSFTYQPDVGFRGSEFFTYRAAGPVVASAIAVARFKVGSTPPPSTPGARVSGRGLLRYYDTRTKLSVQASVSKTGQITGSITSRSSDGGFRFRSLRLQSLTVAGTRARITGFGVRGTDQPDDFAAELGDSRSAGGASVRFDFGYGYGVGPLLLKRGRIDVLGADSTGSGERGRGP